MAKFIAETIALLLLVVGTTSSTLAANPTQVTGVGIPGLVGTVGNGDTLNYLLNATSFNHIPGAGRTTYYFSAAATGAGGVGLDSNDGLTWSAPKLSLCEADRIIETECNVHIVFDSSGTLDTWNTTGEYDCIATSWDGSLGPPPDTCGDTIENPSAFISSSTPVNRARLFGTNLTQDQQTVDCSGEPTYGTNPCDDEGDAFFFGNTGTGENFGWLAVQNMDLNMYPNDERREGDSAIKDIVNGNVLTLNIDTRYILGDGVGFSGQSGGIDININPNVRRRPTGDFDEDCGATTSSDQGCADTDAYTNTELCTNTNTPYAQCENSVNSELRADAPLFWPTAGGTVVLSNKLYRYSTNVQRNAEYQGIARADNGSDLIFLGNMTFANEVHASYSEPYNSALQTNGQPAAIYYGAAGSQAASAGIWAVAFATFEDKWGQSTDALFEMDYDGGNVGLAWALDIYGVYIKDTERAIIGIPAIHGTKTNTDFFRFNCSKVQEFNVAGFIENQSIDTAAANPAIDLTAENSFLDEDDGAVSRIDAVDSATVAASITKFATFAEIECSGDATCATGFFEGGEGDNTASRLITFEDGYGRTFTTLAPYDCPTTLTVTLPSNDSGDSGDRAKDGWIPAYVVGKTIKSFDFGAAPGPYDP